MRKMIIAIGIGIIIIIVAIVVAVDVTNNPTPTSQDSCDLDRNILLPDKCVCSNPPRAECAATSTRPYGLFFTQAASCASWCNIELP